MATESIRIDDVEVGTALPEQSIDITVTLIVGGALASRASRSPRKAENPPSSSSSS